MAQYKGASADGFRAKTLMKKREKQKDEIAHLKCKISENMDQSVNVTQMDRKFASHYDAVEQELKTNTIGLVTLTEMKAKRESVIQDHEKRLVQEKRAKEREQERKRKNKEKEKTEKRSKLSFAFEEEEEEEEENDDEDENEDGDEEDSSRIQLDDGCGSVRRLGKNPDVDTSFLPDKARDEEERLERERLRKEWVEMQEKSKDEEIEVTYSYWDGSGHRKKCLMKQGDSIQKFLQQCLRDLRQEFTDLKAADVSSLMYVKEDLIIPHHYTFYDFIVTKARGKSGPLFDFSVYDDVRITQDASIRRDESHAGKVCMRNWYERNKHIFPASRWEPYDAQKKWEKAAPKE